VRKYRFGTVQHPKQQSLKNMAPKHSATVTDAVKGAAIIHVALKDDASVNEVLEAASSGFARDAIIVDHTTTTKEGAIERTKKWERKRVLLPACPGIYGPGQCIGRVRIYVGFR
jgi:3-hydroxyisobutyrate dehydrogenase